MFHLILRTFVLVSCCCCSTDSAKRDCLFAMSTRPPIEGDGIRVNFFNLLLRTPGEVAPPLRVAIPDTIVFEHNCPRSWFYYDVENREIRKRAGRDLQAGTILAEFGAPSPGHPNAPPITTVATFTYLRMSESDDQPPAVTTLYLTREGLEKLLITTSATKNEGILQKHFLPIETNECVIQSTWGPKLCVIRRRMNCRPISDRPKLISEKHCTFDGPDHMSIEVATAKDTVAEITHTTERIADHVMRASRCKVVSIMLYFKLDHLKRPRLLWCSSLRFDGHRYPDPPAVLFVCPELEGDDLSNDEATLEEVNVAQQRLEKRTRTVAAADGSPPRTAPRLMTTGGISMSDRSKSMNSTGGVSSVAGGAASVAGVAASRDLPPDVRKEIDRICSQWYTVHGDIEDEYHRIKGEQAAAAQIVDDTLYSVHTLFMLQDPADVTVRFPSELGHLLGSTQCVQDFVKAVGLTMLPSGEVIIPSPKSLTSSAPSTTVMMEMARDWLDRHFAKKLSGAMERASIHVQWAALQAALHRV